VFAFNGPLFGARFGQVHPWSSQVNGVGFVTLGSLSMTRHSLRGAPFVPPRRRAIRRALSTPNRQDRYRISPASGHGIHRFRSTASGHGPIANLSRMPSGQANINTPVGDYNDPIFTPGRDCDQRRGEISLSGENFRSPQPVRMAPWASCGSELFIRSRTKCDPLSVRSSHSPLYGGTRHQRRSAVMVGHSVGHYGGFL
jgi:hypothetical protein